MRSFTSSPTKTLRRRFPSFLRNTFATSRIARLSSTERYWSTPVMPVVDGAISEVMRSNCHIPRPSRYLRIFSYSKILSWRRNTFGKPRLGSIFCISIPTTFHFGHTILPITWRKLPGAAHTSSTFIWGLMSPYFSCTSRSLNALRARYPSCFAFSKYVSWMINGLVIKQLTEVWNSIHCIWCKYRSSFEWKSNKKNEHIFSWTLKWQVSTPFNMVWLR